MTVSKSALFGAAYTVGVTVMITITVLEVWRVVSHPMVLSIVCSLAFLMVHDTTWPKTMTPARCEAELRAGNDTYFGGLRLLVQKGVVFGYEAGDRDNESLM
jgi:hypothetical protein